MKVLQIISIMLLQLQTFDSKSDESYDFQEIKDSALLKEKNIYKELYKIQNKESPRSLLKRESYNKKLAYVRVYVNNMDNVSDSYDQNWDSDDIDIDEYEAAINEESVDRPNHLTSTLPSTKITHPTTRMTRPTTRMTRLTTRMTRPTTRMTRLTTRMTRPTTRMTHLTTRMTRPTTRMTRLTTRMTRPTTKMTHPTTRIARPSTTSTHLTTKLTLFSRKLTPPPTKSLLGDSEWESTDENTDEFETTTTEEPFETTHTHMTSTLSPFKTHPNIKLHLTTIPNYKYTESTLPPRRPTLPTWEYEYLEEYESETKKEDTEQPDSTSSTPLPISNYKYTESTLPPRRPTLPVTWEYEYLEEYESETKKEDTEQPDSTSSTPLPISNYKYTESTLPSRRPTLPVTWEYEYLEEYESETKKEDTEQPDSTSSTPLPTTLTRPTVKLIHFTKEQSHRKTKPTFAIRRPTLPPTKPFLPTTELTKSSFRPTIPFIKQFFSTTAITQPTTKATYLTKKPIPRFTVPTRRTRKPFLSTKPMRRIRISTRPTTKSTNPTTKPTTHTTKPTYLTTTTTLITRTPTRHTTKPTYPTTINTHRTTKATIPTTKTTYSTTTRPRRTLKLTYRPTTPTAKLVLPKRRPILSRLRPSTKITELRTRTKLPPCFNSPNVTTKRPRLLKNPRTKIKAKDTEIESSCGIDNAPDFFVSEGRASIETYPWLGVLYYPNGKTRLTTPVVLITKQLVLSTAMEVHKIPKQRFRDSARVVLGRNCSSRGLGILEYNYHPEYRKSTYSSLVIVQLNTADVAKFWDTLHPICGPPEKILEPTFYAKILPEDCRKSRIEIIEMDYVAPENCTDFYRRNDLDIASIWPTRVVCGKGRLGGDCVWNDGTVLAIKQQGKWHLMGFGINGPGCGATSRFVDYTDYHPWVTKSIRRMGNPAITRLDKNEVVIRKTQHIQRFGRCDIEEISYEMYTDTTIIKTATSAYTNIADYNLTLAEAASYSCVSVTATYDFPFLTRIVKPEVRVHAFCLTPWPICQQAGFQVVFFHVQVYFKWKTLFKISVYGKYRKIVDQKAMVKYANDKRPLAVIPWDWAITTDVTSETNNTSAESTTTVKTVSFSK